MERPGERRTATRTAVLWEGLAGQLDVPGRRVVDIGGGTGGLAVRIAGLGHDVTVVDPSPDALAALDRRAREADVADRVTGVQGDLASMPALVGGPVDLVLCHGVLGILADPAAGLATIAQVLAPRGTLSLVVGQLHATVIARAMAGHFRDARSLLEGAPEGVAPRLGGERRFTAEEITGLLADGGYAVTATHGIRVFADLVPGSLLDLEPGATAALLDLERAVSQRPEYLPLAAQLHLLATR